MRTRPGLRWLQNLLILAGLLAAILGPRPLAGLLDLEQARRAMSVRDYAGASSAYASAAERLPWRTSLWEQAGLAAFLAGDDRDAQAYLEKAAGYRPLSPRGWIDLGLTYQGQGDLPSALAAWNNALPMVEAYIDTAQAERRLGKFTAAAADWRAVLDRDPGNAAAHYQLGLLLAASAPSEALSELMRAGQLDPHLDASVQSLRTSLNTALLSDDRAYQLVVSGRGLGAQGEWDLAAEAFRNAVAGRPDYADAWAWLGEAEGRLGGDGLAELQKADGLSPESAMVQALLGFYWQRHGQLPRALAAFQKAAALEPQEAGWELALGGAYEQSGDLVAALDHFTRAVDLAPQEASTWQALASFSVTYGVDVFGTGYPAAQKLLALAPDDWASHDLAGQAALGIGNTSNAVQQYQKAIQLAPDQPAPHLHLAQAYMLLGDLLFAHDQLVQVRSLDPDGSYGFQAGRLLEEYFPGQ